jgi:hypothetical protein
LCNFQVGVRRRRSIRCVRKFLMNFCERRWKTKMHTRWICLGAVNIFFPVANRLLSCCTCAKWHCRIEKNTSHQVSLIENHSLALCQIYERSYSKLDSMERRRQAIKIYKINISPRMCPLLEFTGARITGSHPPRQSQQQLLDARLPLL